MENRITEELNQPDESAPAQTDVKEAPSGPVVEAELIEPPEFTFGTAPRRSGTDAVIDVVIEPESEPAPAPSLELDLELEEPPLEEPEALAPLTEPEEEVPAPEPLSELEEKVLTPEPLPEPEEEVLVPEPLPEPEEEVPASEPLPEPEEEVLVPKPLPEPEVPIPLPEEPEMLEETLLLQEPIADVVLNVAPEEEEEEPEDVLESMSFGDSDGGSGLDDLSEEEPKTAEEKLLEDIAAAMAEPSSPLKRPEPENPAPEPAAVPEVEAAPSQDFDFVLNPAATQPLLVAPATDSEAAPPVQESVAVPVPDVVEVPETPDLDLDSQPEFNPAEPPPPIIPEVDETEQDVEIPPMPEQKFEPGAEEDTEAEPEPSEEEQDVEDEPGTDEELDLDRALGIAGDEEEIAEDNQEEDEDMKLFSRKQKSPEEAGGGQGTPKPQRGWGTFLLVLVGLLLLGATVMNWLELRKLSASLSAGFGGVEVQPSAAEGEPVFEYAIDFLLDPDIAAGMRKRGEAGWQVVGSRRTQDTGTGRYGYEFIFMRQRPRTE